MSAALEKVNSRYKSLVAAVLLLLVLGGVQPYLWRMVYARALDLQEKRSQGQQISNVRERNSQIEAQLQSQGDYMNQLDVVVPPLGARTQIIERLEQLADRLRLDITISAIQQQGSGEQLGGAPQILPVAVSVSVSGTIDQLLVYLSQIEHTQELTVVRNWALSPGAVSRPGAPGPAPLEEGVAYQLTMDVMFFLRDNTSDYAN